MNRAFELTLIALLSAAVGAGAVVALWQPWHKHHRPVAISQPKMFGSYYRPIALARPGALADLYWLGTSVGGCTPFVHTGNGTVERGVVVYSSDGDPNHMCVLVRVLSTQSRQRGAAAAGRALVKEMSHGRKLNAEAVQMSPRRALVQPDTTTVVEITVVKGAVTGAGLPTLKSLVAALTPLPQR